VRRQKLQAFYFDTNTFSLTHAGISLRIRKEGRVWIQTLKASSASQFERLEHNVVVNHAGAAVPVLNIHLHKEHLAYKALLKALRNHKQDLDQLAVRYQTDIWRRVALVRARGAMLEYALDLGVIKAFRLGARKQ
jgi:inorganic triphosphatase YgiF